MLKEQGAVIKSRCLIVLIIEYILIFFQSTKRKNKMNTRKTSICFVAAIFSAAISVSCSDDAAEEAGRGTVEPTDSAVTGTGEYVDPLFADGTYECYPVGTTWRNRSGALQYCYTYEVTKDTVVNKTKYKKVDVRLESIQKQVGRDYVETFDPDTVSQSFMRDWLYSWGDFPTLADSYTYTIPTHGTFFIREDHGRIYEYDQYSNQEVLFYNFNWTVGSSLSCYFWREKLCFEGRVVDLKQTRLNDGETYDVGSDVLVTAGVVLPGTSAAERHCTMIKTIGITNGLFSILPGAWHTYLSDFSRNGQLVYSDERLHE